MKRGPMGCVVFAGAIPARLDDGVAGPGLPGRGLQRARRRRRLHGRLPARLAARRAARHAAALRQRLRRARRVAPRLRAGDAELGRAAALPRPRLAAAARCARTPTSSTCTAPTTRLRDWPALAVLAFDHRMPARGARGDAGLATARSPLPARASPASSGSLAGAGGSARRRAGERRRRRHRRRPLRRGRAARAHRQRLAGSRGRSSCPGSRPLAFEAGDDARRWRCASWPTEHVAKCLVATTRRPRAAARRRSWRSCARSQQACIATDRELLVEVIPPRELRGGDRHRWRARSTQIYAAGVRPDWWKLPPPADAAPGGRIDACDRRHDPHCRGVLLLGLEASEDDARRRLRAGRAAPALQGLRGRPLDLRRGGGRLVRRARCRRRGDRRRRRRATRASSRLWRGRATPPRRRRAEPTLWRTPHDARRIGFIGIGMMGHGMAKNLLAKGYPLTLQGEPQPRAPRRPARGRRDRGGEHAEVARQRRHRLHLRLRLAAGRGRSSTATTACSRRRAPGLIVVDTSTAEPASTARIRADARQRAARATSTRRWRARRRRPRKAA